MKKKLLIILGAGSSVEQRVPSVRDIDEQMAGWARKWAIDTGYQDYFGKLWIAVSKYYSTGDRRYRPGPDFEKVLGEMVALSHWMTPAPWGDSLRETACGGCAPPDLEFPVHPFVEYAPYNATIAIEDQKDVLLATLARHMRAASLRIDPAAEAAKRYRQLVDGLHDAFDVGIYNLNYDTAAINAWPGAYTGFGASGQFEPQVVHRRAEWNFIYHLHGSVHHSLSHEHGGDIRWRNDLSDAAHFFDKPVTSAGDKRSEGRAFSRGTLIDGGYRLDQLLIEPFHSFQDALSRHVYSADAILVGGYGFADVHINRALQNRVGTSAGCVRVMVLSGVHAAGLSTRGRAHARTSGTSGASHHGSSEAGLSRVTTSHQRSAGTSGYRRYLGCDHCGRAWPGVPLWQCSGADGLLRCGAERRLQRQANQTWGHH
jgi:hypothetical protein